jgi:DNA-binding transcriptional MerR regulator
MWRLRMRKADILLMSADVAKQAGVTSEMVRVWERAGRLRAMRTLSGVRLFRQADVTRLLKQRQRRAAARRATNPTY